MLGGRFTKALRARRTVIPFPILQLPRNLAVYITMIIDQRAPVLKETGNGISRQASSWIMSAGCVSKTGHKSVHDQDTYVSRASDSVQCSMSDVGCLSREEKRGYSMLEVDIWAV
jgi:hypothetical protein